MAYPFPTTTDYVDQVNSSSYFPAEISSLMKKVPPSPERFYGSQIDDYIELSVHSKIVKDDIKKLFG